MPQDRTAEDGGQSATALPEDLPRPADHDERMAVVRRAAGWHLGDPSWASTFIGAYLYPRYTTAELNESEARP